MILVSFFSEGNILSHEINIKVSKIERSIFLDTRYRYGSGSHSRRAEGDVGRASAVRQAPLGRPLRSGHRPREERVRGRAPSQQRPLDCRRRQLLRTLVGISLILRR